MQIKIFFPSKFPRIKWSKRKEINESGVLGDELAEGTEGTRLNFSFRERPLCRLFLAFPISSAKPKSLSSLKSCSTLRRVLRAFLGEAHPNAPIWLALALHRLLDPAASTGSSTMSILSVSRALDLRRGEGERSKSSWRGRGLEGDRVLVGDGVLRSTEMLGIFWPPWSRSSIPARREADLVADLWGSGGEAMVDLQLCESIEGMMRMVGDRGIEVELGEI